MRQITGIVIFVTLAVVLFTLALVQSGPRYDDEACDIALQVLKDLRYESGGKMAVSSRSAQRYPMTRGEAEEFAAKFRVDNFMDSERERLLDLRIRETMIAKVKPVEAYANIRAWLAFSRILHDDAKIEAEMMKERDDPLLVVEISMPVVSRDRAHARMWVSIIYNQSPGGGPAELARGVGGRWRVTDIRTTWGR